MIAMESLHKAFTSGRGRSARTVTAVDGLSLHAADGAITGLLGPNGAGKTTLINVLSGDLAASSGSVIYAGEDVTRESSERRSRRGIGRSYQKTNIFGAFTTFENCRRPTAIAPGVTTARTRPFTVVASSLTRDSKPCPRTVMPLR